MGIRQKLMMLSILAGIVVLLISTLGYFQAYREVRNGTERELVMVMKAQAEALDGWLREKQRIALDEANLMTALAGKPDRPQLRELLGLYRDDGDVVNVAYGDETGRFTGYLVGDYQEDVRTRPWYQKLMKERKPSFTEPHMALSTKELVVFAIAPFEDGEGNFAGGICVDISLDAILERVRGLRYRDAGEGFLFDDGGGLIVSSSGESQVGTNLADLDPFAAHAGEILAGETGFFSGKDGDVIAFSKVPATGWTVCFSMPEKAVFAELAQLRITYGLLTLFGLSVVALIFFLCTRFAAEITESVTAIERHAREIARGNLALDALKVMNDDEIGSLTKSFNTMLRDLRDLVWKTSGGARDVMGAAGDLTKYVELTAQAAHQISEMAGKVSHAMMEQMEDVETMAANVDAAFADVNGLSVKSAQLVETVSALAESAALLRQDTQSALASFSAEGGEEIGGQELSAIDRCFIALAEELEGIQEQAREMDALAKTVEDGTGHIIDTVGSIDGLCRKTARSSETIEASTQEQEASILEIVAAAESLEALALDMNKTVERFRL